MSHDIERFRKIMNAVEAAELIVPLDVKQQLSAAQKLQLAVALVHIDAIRENTSAIEALQAS